jgi:hypothetical protein
MCVLGPLTHTSRLQFLLVLLLGRSSHAPYLVKAPAFGAHVCHGWFLRPCRTAPHADGDRLLAARQAVRPMATLSSSCAWASCSWRVGCSCNALRYLNPTMRLKKKQKQACADGERARPGGAGRTRPAHLPPPARTGGNSTLVAHLVACRAWLACQAGASPYAPPRPPPARARPRHFAGKRSGHPLPEALPGTGDLLALGFGFLWALAFFASSCHSHASKKKIAGTRLHFRNAFHIIKGSYRLQHIKLQHDVM